MSRSTLFAALAVVFVAIAYSMVRSSEADQPPATKSEEKSALSYLKPGQRVMHTRYEGGLVRLEVVTDDLLAAEKRQGKSIGEWPTVHKVADDYVVLKWDTEERTATQVLPKTTILEIWLDNKTK